MTRLTIFAAIAAIALSAAADARTLRWARSGDGLTLDPHALNEDPTHALNHQIYEPLVLRDEKGALIPALALSWRLLPEDNTIWEFKLRQGVKYHNGNDFNADDVVFSLERALQPTAEMKGLLTAVDKVSKVDDFTVHVKTKGVYPLFPNNLTNMFMMDKEWAEANNATKPQDFKNKEENFAVRNANGTGAFQLVSREPDVRTVMRRFDGYWGKAEGVPSEVSELIYLPIKADATRIAALLSGEVDFVHDVPVQDTERLKQTPNIRVNTGPENRTILIGMDVGSPDLKTDDVEGKNPLADRRVREALNIAINRATIQRVVMRGQSEPTGVIIPPFVNGWTPELNKIPEGDAQKAKALLAEAGYGDGFTITFHCPNDRYINDEGICQAVVGMWGQIGVKANLVSQSKTLHFPMITKTPPETELFLFGWGVPPFDSEYVFSFLVHTRKDKFGAWNALNYSNPDLDAKIVSLSSETDTEKRNATIAEIWSVVKGETLYLPIHNQVLAYAMKSDIDIPVDPENKPKMKMVTFKGN